MIIGVDEFLLVGYKAGGMLLHYLCSLSHLPLPFCLGVAWKGLHAMLVTDDTLDAAVVFLSCFSS